MDDSRAAVEFPVTVLSDGGGLLLRPDAATWSVGGQWDSGMPTIVVDIDGTLSDPGHRRHHLEREPSDWRAFSLSARSDPPLNDAIAKVNRRATGVNVILSSGRPHYVLEITASWLAAHSVAWGLLALRPARDRCRGVDHKLRVLGALRAAGVHPYLAIDDSAEATRAYRRAGLECQSPADADWDVTGGVGADDP